MLGRGLRTELHGMRAGGISEGVPRLDVAVDGTLPQYLMDQLPRHPRQCAEKQDTLYTT